MLSLIVKGAMQKIILCLRICLMFEENNWVRLRANRTPGCESVCTTWVSRDEALNWNWKKVAD